MVSSIYNNISALQAYGKKMSVISNNVANVNTDEFKKSTANLVEGESENSVTVNIRESDQPGAIITDARGQARETSNVDLAEELPQTVVTRHGYEANLQMIRSIDEMFKNVLDIFA